MWLGNIFCTAVLAAVLMVASAAKVPSAVYNGLGYGVPLTHAGPAVRVARPARSLHNGEHHRRDDIRHAHLGGGGS